MMENMQADMALGKMQKVLHLDQWTTERESDTGPGLSI